jgi:hypothetical protein
LFTEAEVFCVVGAGGGVRGVARGREEELFWTGMKTSLVCSDQLFGASDLIVCR